MGLQDDISRAHAEVELDAARASVEARSVAEQAARTEAMRTQARHQLDALAREAIDLLIKASIRPQRLSTSYEYSHGWNSIQRKTARGPKGWDLHECPSLTVDGDFVTFTSHDVYARHNSHTDGLFTVVDFTPPPAKHGTTVRASWRLALEDDGAPAFVRRVQSEYRPDPSWPARELVAKALVFLGI